MRSLRKDKKKLYISRRLPSIPILDDDNNFTGEYAKVYDEWVRLNLDIKPISDVKEQQIFGEDSDKTLKITYTLYDSNNVEIENYSAVWLDIEPNGVLSDSDQNSPMNNNYVVVKTINFGSQNAAYIKKVAGFRDEN